MSLWRRLKYLLPSYGRAEERDLQEEFHSLRAMAKPGELGNLAIAAESARAQYGWSWIENAAQDFRYGLRALLRHRRVTVVALLSLALGIGVNTLVFSFVHTLLLRPLPYPESDRLVLLGFTPQNGPRQMAGLTRGNCESLRDGIGVFEEFGCYTDPAAASIADYNTAETPPERLRGRQFTAGAARALGVTPVLGRWFTEADEREGADRVLLVSFGVWRSRFSGSPEVLHKTIRMNGEPATIIGVLPDNFEFLDLDSDFCIPLQGAGRGTLSPARVLGGLARLKLGITLPGAQSEMDAVSARLAEKSPETNKGWSIAVRPLHRLDETGVSNEAREPLLILQSAVAFVLLIACANVAGLLLAQGATQNREIAVRAALGSGRGRIFRQLLTHSLLLAFAGGTLGLMVGLIGVRLLAKLLPAGLPHAIYATHLNPGVLVFTLGISVISGLIVGITPALQVSQAEPLAALRESSSTATAPASRQKLRSVFVVFQIALALMLLVEAPASAGCRHSGRRIVEISGIVPVIERLFQAR